MSFNLTTSGACIAKAGINANVSGALLATWCDQAEATLSMLTRKDWVNDYSIINTNFKNTLNDVVSDMVAMKIINYDMSGFTSRLEAQTMLDVLRDNKEKCIEALKNDNIKEVME